MHIVVNGCVSLFDYDHEHESCSVNNLMYKITQPYPYLAFISFYFTFLNKKTYFSVLPILKPLHDIADRLNSCPYMKKFFICQLSKATLQSPNKLLREDHCSIKLSFKLMYQNQFKYLFMPFYATKSAPVKDIIDLVQSK